MNSQPKVTVAIPVYNVEPYVARSLNSVIQQDYNNIEILIVYDLSNDRSLEVTVDTIKKSPFPYKIIEKKEKEKGLGNSRNVILNNLKGDYLFFLDSDDFIEPGTISLLVKEAIENNADVVAASHRSIDEHDNTINTFQYQEKKILDNLSLKRHVYVQNFFFSVYSWNKLYKASLLLENDIRCIHNVVEDAVFSFLIIEKANKTVLLTDITLNYLIRRTSITNAIMYNDISIDTAMIYLAIRDFKYSYNNERLILENICSNIDAFLFCYIMTVRDSYKSKIITIDEKKYICKMAFLTPPIPLRHFFQLLLSKKTRLILLFIVKILPLKANMLLVQLYHKIRNL